MLDSNTLGSSPAAGRKTWIDPRSNKAKKYTDVLEASDLRDSDTARSNQVSNSFFFHSGSNSPNGYSDKISNTSLCCC